MRDSNEFSFLDFGPPSRSPRPPTLQKIDSAADYTDYRSKLRAMRPIAYALLAFWIATYTVIAYLAGWFDRWLS